MKLASEGALQPVGIFASNQFHLNDVNFEPGNYTLSPESVASENNSTPSSRSPMTLRQGTREVKKSVWLRLFAPEVAVQVKQAEAMLLHAALAPAAVGLM